jgi:hypothetical protein
MSLCVATLYIGGYLASLKPPPQTYVEVLDRRDSIYRWGGAWPFIIFWPIEQVDRKLRPRTWGEVEITDQELLNP